MIPTKMFFTKGVGRHKDRLHSFELALRNAGIEMCNLVSVSSILPPKCKIITRDKGVKMIKPGQIIFCVMARNSTEEPNRLIAASVGLAIPSDREHAYGYLSEHHSYGETERKCGDHAEDIAASMLGNTLGIEVDPDKAWDDRKQEFKTHDRIFKTTAITQSAIGDKEGHWTSVIAAAVFVDETDEGETEVINNKFEIVQNVQEKLDFPENSNENAEHVKENNAPKTEEPKAKEKTS